MFPDHCYVTPGVNRCVSALTLSLALYLFLSDLNTSTEELMEDVDSFLHQSDIRRGGISTLAVLDGVNEAVPKLTQRTQQVLLYEIHHTVV